MKGSSSPLSQSCWWGGSEEGHTAELEVLSDPGICRYEWPLGEMQLRAVNGKQRIHLQPGRSSRVGTQDSKYLEKQWKSRRSTQDCAEIPGEEGFWRPKGDKAVTGQMEQNGRNLGDMPQTPGRPAFTPGCVHFRRSENICL